MKTIKCMMDHLYWADGRILDAQEPVQVDYIVCEALTGPNNHHYSECVLIPILHPHS